MCLRRKWSLPQHEPDDAVHHTKRRRVSGDGVTKDHDEEERNDPTSTEQRKKQTQDSSHSFYKFLYGTSYAALRALVITERKACCQIAMELHEGVSRQNSATTTGLGWNIFARLSNAQEFLSIKPVFFEISSPSNLQFLSLDSVLLPCSSDPLSATISDCHRRRKTS